MIKMKYRGRVRVRLVQTEDALSLSSKECKCIQRYKDSRIKVEIANEIDIEIENKFDRIEHGIKIENKIERNEHGIKVGITNEIALQFERSQHAIETGITPNEITNVLEHVPPTTVPPALLDDEDDDQIAAYIDLVILAIIKNMEHQQVYIESPSAQLRHEIAEHSKFINNAETCMNIHIKKIICNFKTLIKYDEVMTHGIHNGIFDNDYEITKEIELEIKIGITHEITKEIKHSQCAIEIKREIANEIERTQYEIQINNGIKREIANEIERTQYEIQIDNGIEREIANEIERTQHEIEIDNGIEREIANESEHTQHGNAVPNEIGHGSEKISNGLQRTNHETETRIADIQDALVTMNADINIEISYNDENEIIQHCNSNTIEIKKQPKNEIEIKLQRMIENAIYKMKNSNRQDQSAASNKMKGQATNIFTCLNYLCI
jgi:hypothetical protein